LKNEIIIMGGRSAFNTPQPGANGRPNRLQIISMTIQPAEELVVGAALCKTLGDARKAANA
jgi:hypothetical protein